MATNAKTILQEIRAVIATVTGFTTKSISSNRKKDAAHSGTFTASVLYQGEDLSQFVISSCNERIDHVLPLAIDIRTTSASDDDLIDKLYAVLDAVLLPANKPTDVITVLPESIDAPEGEDYLTCRININVIFRRS